MFSGIEQLVNDTTRYRYNNDIPAPHSCEECGYEEKSHGMVFSKNVGLHLWVKPDNARILARMKARRSSR